MSRLTYLARHPGRTLGALAVATAAVGLTIGSGADFTASTANPANVFTSGSLSMTNSKNAAAVLTASGMMPGDQTTGVVDIKNTGSGTGTFTLNESNVTSDDATYKLAHQLSLTIKDCGLFAGATPPDCTGGTTVYTGALDGVTSTDLGDFAAGDQHRYQFTVTLPQATDNNFQNRSASAQFDWTATA